MFDWIKVLVSRIHGLLARREIDEDFQQELDAHLEILTEENIRRGMSPEEARRAARLRLGGMMQLREIHRELWGLPWLETVVQDLRYGLRQLRRNPGFTVVAVLTLALGIGANTAIFSLINTVMLRQLPVRRPGQLVLFSDNAGQGMSIGTGLERNARWTEFSYPLYRDFVRRDQLLQGICAFQSGEDEATVRIAGKEHTTGTQVAQAKTVSGNYFAVLGINALIGRTLRPADDQPGSPPVTVASFKYWKNKLGGDPAIVGRELDINRKPVTLVGVMPRGFFGERVEAGPADLWLPIRLRPSILLSNVSWAKQFVSDPYTEWLNLMGRLKRGVSMTAANAEINGELRQYLSGLLGSKLTPRGRVELSHQYVQIAPGGRGLSTLRHVYSKPLQILLAVVALVLLIACANVANLLLSRATDRQREIATRMAVGATRARVVRQMLSESALLVILGGTTGALLSAWGVHIIVSLVAPKTPLNIKPDLSVLVFTLVISLITVILAGLAPSLRATRVDLVSAFKAGSSSSRDARLGLGKRLMAFQIALSLVLLVGAGLLLRTLVNLEDQNLGFNPAHVLLVNIQPRLAGYKPNQLSNLYKELVDRISTLPGVRSASVGATSPMSGARQFTGVCIEGEPRQEGEDNVHIVRVGTRYFETLGISILAGRDFSAQDNLASPAVVLVNEAFARRFLPGENPLGRRLALDSSFKPPGLEIVGMVGDTRYTDPGENAGPALFIPVEQLEADSAYVDEIEVRSTGDPTAVTEEVRRAIHGIDSNLPVTNVKTLSSQVSGSLLQERIVSELTGVFGMLGLILACVGLYGVMAYNVSRRTNEIGIRMALGAQKLDVLRLVVSEGMFLALIGVGIGIAAALALTRFLSSLLYGVKSTDPETFIAVSLILTAVALLACYIPARRATKVDPMVALRYE